MTISTSSTPELEFEDNLIERLTTGVTTSEGSRGIFAKESLWEYLPDVHTTEDLWENFRKILESNNASVLDGRPLTDSEFSQIKSEISRIRTPFEAARFLYGMNGECEVEVRRDTGETRFLRVFRQSEIGAGNSVYQVVKEIRRPPKQAGARPRRFDVVLLINGLPLIHIELKKDSRDPKEALRQIRKYAAEGQHSDIFSVVQLWVGMTEIDALYMAACPPDSFSTDFAFHWTRHAKGEPEPRTIRDWTEFCDYFLSIPTAHKMASNYIVADSTPGRESIRVMRPYQVEATERAVERIMDCGFTRCDRKVGTVWHTTGSGKTITSYKTAWLATSLPNVDKVVFVVDRKNLTGQTYEAYMAYSGSYGCAGGAAVRDTQSSRDLMKALNDRNSRAITVTSTQKLHALVKKPWFKDPESRILFIVDEAHRSTGSEKFREIQNSFSRSAWLGYTGTPKFLEEDREGETPKNSASPVTEDVFGKVIHAYTIRNAIADGNVLGFKVDFETTIDLVEFYKKQSKGKLGEERIREMLTELSEIPAGSKIPSTAYDMNERHVSLVVEDISDKWRNRSADYKYNAVLTIKVGGNRPSAPMAMMYFRAFLEENKRRKARGDRELNLAVSFTSSDGSNSENTPLLNRLLLEAIDYYNSTYGKSFDLSSGDEYMENLTARFRGFAGEGEKPIDLLIVIDQYLTGFDAPRMNTLYVDRMLKGAVLIQAYSRTNRICDSRDKLWGNIVNYRFPAESKREMDRALAVYADEKYGKKEKEEQEEFLKKSGISAEDWNACLKNCREAVEKIRRLTKEFSGIPPSDSDVDSLAAAVRERESCIEKLRQFPEDSESGEGFDYNHPEKLLEKIGMTETEEKKLSTTIKREIREHMKKRKKRTGGGMEAEDPFDGVFSFSHLVEQYVDYNYIRELLEQLAEAKRNGDEEKAETLYGRILDELTKITNPLWRKRYLTAADEIRENRCERALKPGYRIGNVSEEVVRICRAASERKLDTFRYDWGLLDLIENDRLREFAANHTSGETGDLDSTRAFSDLLRTAQEKYKSRAHDARVAQMKKRAYRMALTDEIYRQLEALKEM